MLLLYIFDYLGTIAFAVSGALLGIKKELDIFGVIFLAITTAVGGGIFRDVMIGTIPPTALTKPIYCILGIIFAILTFILNDKIIKLQNIILIMDAIGLGVFTAIGSNSAFTNGYDEIFVVVVMGLLTGVGGGILRDVFVNDIPLVFRKEIYAVASIIGAISFYFANIIFTNNIAMYICFLITFLIRILAIMHKLNLPIVRAGNIKYNKEL